MMGFLFLLGLQGVVEVLQKRHVLRNRVLEVLLINLMDTAVDDRFLHRLQAFLAAHDQFTE